LRRWNGWGDESIEFALDPNALDFLRARLGPGTPSPDATLEQASSALRPTRLAAHPLLDADKSVRVRHALGQSMHDWLRLRYGRIGEAPDAVAFPESSAEVRELLAFATQQDARVIPYGGGTSVVGHLEVLPGERPVLSIDMSRMARLLEIDTTAQLATFEAGVAGPHLEAQLRAHGAMLGHFPQSFEYATLGGWIATRSSGQQSLRYGRIEQLFAGGRVETPTGTLRIPAFPASAAGTDLRELVLGSEGRIGILTEATVRITPLPQQESFHALFFPTWEAAEVAVRTLAQARLPLSMLRLSNPIETLTTLTLAGHRTLIGWLERYLGWRGCGDQKCLLLMGVSGPMAASTLRHALALARTNGAVHAGRAIGAKWKANRFRNVYLRNALWQQGYAVDTVETATDWPNVGTMMHAVEQAGTDALAREGEALHAYTHLSHVYAQGASVYTTFVYRLAGDYERDLARWRSLKAAASTAIVGHGGTISHQHGVGIDHAPYLAAEKGERGLDAMRALFLEFDPQQRMNPGKLVSAGKECRNVGPRLA
jgi:alkyldihydroxyacetonephosphate synthase